MTPNSDAIAGSELAAKYERHVNPAFMKLLDVFGYGRLFVKAEDTRIWDSEGREYLDALAGFGAINLGHNHPLLLQQIEKFIYSSPLHLCHIGPSSHQAVLAEQLARLLPDSLQVTQFCSGGAEAVEAALKLARAATGRSKVIYCRGAYHGTTLGTLSLMGSKRMRAPFEPLLPGCLEVPFGDVPALEAALSADRYAAFIVEPIQAEGGVNLPPESYLSQVRELCRRHRTLLVFDEIQTGIGRTGAMFECLRVNTFPDILVLGKSLGGGMTPVSAIVTSRQLFDRAYGTADRFDLQSSTFGGNGLACAIASATLNIVRQEGLAARAAARGLELLTGLRQSLAEHPYVKDIRGQGLMVAVELGPTQNALAAKIAPEIAARLSEKLFGQWLAYCLLQRGIICQPASHSWNILKLTPPLTISEEQVRLLVTTLAEVLWDYQSIVRVSRDAVLAAVNFTHKAVY